MESLNIVQVTPFFGSQSYGGTERYVSHLSSELVKRGHNLEIFTTKKSTNIPYQTYYENMIVHRFYSPWNVFGINPACFMLHKMLQLENIDVFHVHSYIYFTTIQAAINKLVRKTPMLLHVHGGVGRPPYKTGFLREFAKLFFDYTFGRFVLSQADTIASVSEYDATLIRETIHSNLSKIEIINNAIDPSLFQEVEPVCSKKCIITFVGDLEPWKGIPYYTRVVQKVLKRSKKAEFWFLGYGSLYDSLKMKFENEKRVKIYGAVEHTEVPNLLSKSNILVQPSFWEGSPTTIIEAMAMGIPVIGSEIGDIPRLLEHGKSGKLFKAGNGEELEQKLIEAIEHYDDFAKAAQEARPRIRTEFSFTKVTDKIEKLYYKMVAKKN
ncbi:glycosyltransferase family 1 protein [Candidatus Heimdallarchaeota archaeon]|nr:MAG: glycosyltransferase family 1 protein [Candidatus Heimdallarchaeota archaeon]